MADVLGYGGSAGGGKSDLVLGLAITRHRRSLLLRREFKNVRALVDRCRELLGDAGRFNENTGIWRGLPGGRQLEFGGVKNPGDEQTYRGRPHDLIAYDEADQFPEHVVRFIMGWNRTTDPAQRCRTVICFNPPANAEGRWLIPFFGPWLDRAHPRPAAPGELRWYATLPDGKEVERPDGGPFVHDAKGKRETITPRSRTFIPARVTDNRFLMATGYVGTLQALPEPLRSQLLYGDMEAGLQDDAWQVIPTAWVRQAQARWTPTPPEGQRLSCLGVDLARGGSDQMVIAPRYGPWFAPLLKYPGKAVDDGPKAAALVLAAYRDDAEVNLDVIGIGSSPYDCLKAEERLRRRLHAVNNAAAADARDRTGTYKMANVRAASYWKLREALDPVYGEHLALPPDPELLADLCAPRFELQASGVKVEPKDRVIERLGRSPDCGDAAVLAHWRPPSRKLAIL